MLQPFIPIILVTSICFYRYQHWFLQGKHINNRILLPGLWCIPLTIIQQNCKFIRNCSNYTYTYWSDHNKIQHKLKQSWYAENSIVIKTHLRANICKYISMRFEIWLQYFQWDRHWSGRQWHKHCFPWSTTYHISSGSHFTKAIQSSSQLYDIDRSSMAYVFK